MTNWRSRSVAWAFAAAMAATTAAAAQVHDKPLPEALQSDLAIAPPGQPMRRLSLADALRELHIPAVGIAVIDRGELAFVQRVGDTAEPDSLYQAASLSKFVTAIGALRLVQEGRLSLDGDVDATLTTWRLPDSPLTREHPVTLRGLLSMTAGIGVPGYRGYPPGARLPTLQEILDGRPPANSPPVRVVAVPGSVYAYSGGGYEIVQALIEDATGKPFAQAMQDLVLAPAGMTSSTFAQPLPDALSARAATGHRQDGSELPGGWRVVPELAAGGLWSTPADLARLLVRIGRAFRGEDEALLSQRTAASLFTRQEPGPYGLGAAVAGSGTSLVMMKRGQNVGYQAFLIMFPATGQGMVVMTGSDNGTTLANVLVRRAAAAYGWPPLGELVD